MFQCGVYLRISREDRDMSESDSIANQRKIIHTYIERYPDLKLCYEWIDDGVSGIHFKRPGIESMLAAIEDKKVNCIIVKDLSRFGRDYIETGYYLQHYFPQKQIRFIAVCDQYDSSQSDFLEKTLLVPILNILNDSYCQDISRKVRLGQDIKRREGAYIGAFCVYGYKKSSVNHNELIIDDTVSCVIQKIFDWRMQGYSAEKISFFLNHLEIPSPAEYKRQMEIPFVTTFRKSSHTLWAPTAVRRILQNEMYTGILLQGKTRKINYKLSMREKVPKQSWVTIKIPSLEIVSKQAFVSAQKPLKRGRKEKTYGCNLCKNIGTTPR